MAGAGQDWRPTADWPALALRARLLGACRDFFGERGLTEVETPALVRWPVTDLHVENIGVSTADGSLWYLHSSPEFHMKRLLAAGAPDIWQLCKVFRDGERGTRHEPEFTMVEWYRLGWTLGDLMQECAALLATLAREAGRELGAPVHHQWAALVEGATGMDPLEAAGGELVSRVREVLHDCLPSAALLAELGTEADGWLDLLFTQRIVPGFPADRPVIVAGWPASQAALARLLPEDPRVAERAELFLGPLELANGYRELTDPGEQARRMRRDRARRRALGRADREPDPRLLGALEHGLPDCAGVALGFDRVLMALTGNGDIARVLSFGSNAR